MRAGSERRRWFLLALIAIAVLGAADGFALSSSSVHSPRPPHSGRQSTSYLSLSSNNKNNNADHNNSASMGGGNEFSRRQQQQQQEADFEAMSVRGASKIAHMDISERTKRALLAEAVENRIFSLQQELLELAQLQQQQQPRSSDGGGGKYYATAKKLAQQIKLAQGQYYELVNGDPSDMLRAYDSLAASSSSSSSSSSSDMRMTSGEEQE